MKRPRTAPEPPRRCLFCGDLASETRLLERLNRVICEDCFDLVGNEFSRPGNTPIFIPHETCISCGRTARGRLLVAGVAAGICRGCYLTAKKGRGAAKRNPSVFLIERTLRRALDRNRTVRQRHRRKHARLGEKLRSLPPEKPLPPGTKFSLHDRLPRRIGLMFMQAITKIPLWNHLDLVTSMEKVRGRRVLKFPDGKSPTERMRAARRN